MKKTHVSIFCDRCGAQIEAGWERQPDFNQGSMLLRLPSTAFRAILRQTITDPNSSDPCPPVVVGESHGQLLVLRWGDDDGGYLLCHDCQQLLVRTVGEFFDIRPVYTPDPNLKLVNGEVDPGYE